MFIEHTTQQISQSPRGATCEQYHKDKQNGRPVLLRSRMHILNWMRWSVTFKIRRRIIPIKRSGKSISRFLNILMSHIIPNMFLMPTTVPRHDTHVAPLGL